MPEEIVYNGEDFSVTVECKNCGEHFEGVFGERTKLYTDIAGALRYSLIDSSDATKIDCPTCGLEKKTYVDDRHGSYEPGE